MNLETLSAPLPTAEQMRAWDGQAMAHGIPECILMENAAREALTVLQKQYGPLDGAYVLLFMGPGNNGGDAACLARHLLDAGAFPLLAHTKPMSQYKGASKQHLEMAKKCHVLLQYIGKDSWQKHIPPTWQKPHIMVDGLLGTGFTTPLRPLFKEYICHINAHKEHSFIFSLDIPSGCDALTGMPHPQDFAVKADATVAFAAAKPGLVLPSARSYTGKLHVRTIGIPRVVQQGTLSSFRLLQKNRIITLFQDGKEQSHKGSWGHVLVVGGSQEKTDLSGAAHLTALAALRTGAGLVTAAAPKGLSDGIKNGNANIMAYTFDQEHWPTTLPQAFQEKLTRMSCLAVGPGMGISEQAKDFLGALLAYPKRPRAVLDADAITLLALHPYLQSLIRHDDMLTPHPGEAARLLGCTSQDIQKDRFAAMASLQACIPCAWLLKGVGTLLGQSQSPIYIFPHDIPALAVAGSGDVLTGCTAALASRLPHLDSLSTLALGACIHTQAGLMIQKKFPHRGHMASELAHAIPKAITKLTAKAQTSLQAEVYTLE